MLYPRFTASDFQKLATVLQNAVAVPVHGETTPFILPSMTEIVLTQLQDSVLQAMHILLKVNFILIYNLYLCIYLLVLACKVLKMAFVSFYGIFCLTVVIRDWLKIWFQSFQSLAQKVILAISYNKYEI